MPNNPVSQNYDYQNGRGLDSFLSAAIDEVSWETSLASTFNTLSQSPIGQSAYSNTAINYDQSQISGSQGGTTTLGGSGGGSAGTGGSGNLQLDPANNQLHMSDGNYQRLLLGLRSDGKFVLDISPPGKDTSSGFLSFTSEQITGVTDFPSIQVPSGLAIAMTVNAPAVQHNLGFIPDYHIIAIIPNPSTPDVSLFPATYSIPLPPQITITDRSGNIYTYNHGIDQNALYMSMSYNNNAGAAYTSLDIKFLYFINKSRIV